MTAQYVYGVTYVDTTVPGDLSGIDDAPVLAVSHDRCAALVSDLTGDRPLGTRDDLIAHERVLEALAREGRPLLPFRFGGMLPGMDEIPGELLGPNQDRFLADLDRVKDRVELVVKGRYEETAFREVVQEDAEVRELREQIRGLPKDAGHYEQIRLGELVGQALARRQAADGERLIDKLTSCAEAVVTRKPAHDDEVADAAFLVPLDRRAEFERALDELAVEWADRIRLRLLGPLPPYDFVGSSEAQET